jgi:hypothetical protein
LTGRPVQARGLDRLVAVLAAEPRARGRDDHPDRGLAGQDRKAVDEHGTRAARTFAAAQLGAALT